MQMKPGEVPPDLAALLEKARDHKWTYEELLEQKLSFVASGSGATVDEIRRRMIERFEIPDLDAIRADARLEGLNKGLDMALKAAPAAEEVHPTIIYARGRFDGISQYKEAIRAILDGKDASDV